MADLPILRISGGMPVINDACPIGELLFGRKCSLPKEREFFTRRIVNLCKAFRIEDFNAHDDQVLYPDLPCLVGPEGLMLGYLNKMLIIEATSGNKQARKSTRYRGSYVYKMLTHQHLPDEVKEDAIETIERIKRKLIVKQN